MNACPKFFLIAFLIASLSSFCVVAETSAGVPISYVLPFRAGLIVNGPAEKLWTLSMTGTPPMR